MDSNTDSKRSDCELSNGKQSAIKRSRLSDDDEDPRKHRSRTDHERSFSPDRTHRERKHMKRSRVRDSSPHRDEDGRGRSKLDGGRVSKQDNEYSPSMDRNCRNRDRGQRESLSPQKPRDKKRYEGDDHSSSSGRVDGCRRRDSNSPFKHRDKRINDTDMVSSRTGDHSLSPERKYRDHRLDRRRSNSPLHHRDRSKHDGIRVSDRKERVSGRNDARITGKNDKVNEEDDRSKGTERNAGERDGAHDRGKDENARLHDIGKEGNALDRYPINKDLKLHEADKDGSRFIGKEGSRHHDRDDRWRHRGRDNKEDYVSADEEKREGRLKGKEGDRGQHTRKNEKYEKRKSWAEDELATKNKQNRELSPTANRVPKQSTHAKAPTRDRDAEKEKKLSKSNVSATDASAEMPQGKSGGVYIPPFKLAQMMKEIQDKSSVEYQRMTWDALRKSINGLVNKVNASNIKNIIPELLSENLIRGRGLFARSCMKSQMASPVFTHVFAALVAVVNTKFPELGELLLKRVILQFRRALRRNDKPLLLAAARFIAHLVNQQVAHEIVALEVLMVLLENPTDDSVEVSVGFVKECGAILQDLAPQGLHGIFERFRGILHEGEIDKRVQFMIEGLFAIRKAGFQGHPAVIPELDLVEQEDQFTHELSISEDLEAEMGLDIFKPDPNFLENEKKYEAIKRDILGEESSDDDEDGERGSGISSDDDEDDEDDDAEMQRMQIKDETETNLVNLRRTIYLTIMSSVDFEEAGHKLLKIKLEPGQEMELNIMLLECCSQERTYLRYYGLLGQRFCMINQIYQKNFDECFVKQYSMIHRLETNKLRNVAKFFAHLLGTDALPWHVLGYIRLTEEDTTSSSRIFIKILFQELSEHLGLRKLNEKLNDPVMQGSFDGIFPKDNPKNTRFAINFFTSIGLGGITDNLREYLKNMPRLIMQQQRQVDSELESSDSDDTSDSKSSSVSDSESESQSESESESDSKRKRKRK